MTPDRCCPGSRLRSSCTWPCFIITVGVNVPLNDGIKAAGDPDRIADLAAVGERFDEEK
jgi:hypothetical protein